MRELMIHTGVGRVPARRWRILFIRLLTGAWKYFHIARSPDGDRAGVRRHGTSHEPAL